MALHETFRVSDAVPQKMAGRLQGLRRHGRMVLYGLGAETQDLPAFVVMSSGSGLSGGSALWSSGFLPAQHQGVVFRGGDPEDPQADSELKAAVEMVRRRASIDPKKLADENVELRKLATT